MITACIKTGDGTCGANAAYFIEKGALSQLYSDILEAETCFEADDGTRAMGCQGSSNTKLADHPMCEVWMLAAWFLGLL